jgi:hypothetical protein
MRLPALRALGDSCPEKRGESVRIAEDMLLS